MGEILWQMIKGVAAFFIGLARLATNESA